MLQTKLKLARPLAGMLVLAGVQLAATPGTAPKEAPPTGFSRGAIHLSLTSGSLDEFGGSFVERERSRQDDIKTTTLLGLSPMKVLGGRPAPLPLNLPARITSEPSLQFAAELGVSDHWGFGIAAQYVRLNSVRQDQNPDPATGGAGVYTEFVPTKVLYYKGHDMMLHAAYHFLPSNILDPFVTLRLGAVSFQSQYRENYASFNHILNAAYPPRGRGTVAGASVGMNFFFLPQMALRLELSGSHRWLRSESFAREKFWSVRLDAGATFDFNHIRRM